ncbi:MAG: 2-amino-4-hydroxy-6-hydroxymethyldihydropteridine diphosphokinase [Planctomycetota bacterium]
MGRAFVAAGSNLGDRLDNLERAFAAVGRAPGVSSLTGSRVYETPPVGPSPQGAYLNAVWELQTSLTPRAMLDVLQAVEAGLGRPPADERQAWGPRVIDLDLLAVGEHAVDEPGLTVPHPRARERWFVLRPWADLAPGFTPAGWSTTVSEALAGVERSGDPERGGLPGRRVVAEGALP